MSNSEPQCNVPGSFRCSVRMKICIREILPAHVEDVSDEAWVRKFLNSSSVEENSNIWEFLVRTVVGAVECIIDQFNFFHELRFALIEVSTSGINDHAHRASLTHCSLLLAQLLKRVQYVLLSHRHNLYGGQNKSIQNFNSHSNLSEDCWRKPGNIHIPL